MPGHVSHWRDFEAGAHDEQQVHLVAIGEQAAIEAVVELLAEEDDIGLGDQRCSCPTATHLDDGLAEPFAQMLRVVLVVIVAVKLAALGRTRIGRGGWRQMGQRRRRGGLQDRGRDVAGRSLDRADRRRGADGAKRHARGKYAATSARCRHRRTHSSLIISPATRCPHLMQLAVANEPWQCSTLRTPARCSSVSMFCAASVSAALGYAGGL